MEKAISKAASNADNIKKMMTEKVDELSSKMAAIGVDHALDKITTPGQDDQVSLTVGAYVDALVGRGFSVTSHSLHTTLLPDGNCFTTVSLLVKRGSIIPASKLLIP